MTLTELSFYSRRFLPFLLLGIMFFVFLYFSIQLLLLTRRPPTVVPTYSMLFGNIPKLTIKGIETPTYPKFFLDTLTGLPQLQNEKGETKVATDGAEVYLLPIPKTRTTFQDRVILTAKKLGVITAISSSEAYTLKDNIAEFEGNGKKLSINIKNFNFEFEDTILSFNNTKKSENEIITDAINHLVAMDRYPQELSQGEKKVTYLFYDDKTREYAVLPFEEISNANAYEVHFFRAPTDGYPIVTERYISSPTYVLLTYKREENNFNPVVVKSQAQFYEKFLSQEKAMYPLKTVEEAFTELKEGKSTIIYYDSRETQIPVQQITLAYFEPNDYQEYLQPVFVFSNNKNSFVAYVPAIREEYTLEGEELPPTPTPTIFERDFTEEIPASSEARFENLGIPVDPLISPILTSAPIQITPAAAPGLE